MLPRTMMKAAIGVYFILAVMCGTLIHYHGRIVALERTVYTQEKRLEDQEFAMQGVYNAFGLAYNSQKAKMRQINDRKKDSKEKKKIKHKAKDILASQGIKTSSRQ